MVKIVTDSTCDLSNELIKQYDIAVVPLTVYFGDEAYKDGLDISSLEFYKFLCEKNTHPTTSQPSPEAFKEVYKNILANGDEIISLHISSGLSGTYQSAVLASKQLDNNDITVIDSKNLCLSLASIVLESAKAAKEGKSKDDILKMIQNMISNTELYFVVDTLEYMQKGGRIGKASALMGSLLNIKPILTLKDGTVTPFDKVRGAKKALNKMGELVKDFVTRNEGKEVLISYAWGGNPVLLDEFMNTLPEEYKREQDITVQIGAVVGAHIGPGAFGVSLTLK